MSNKFRTGLEKFGNLSRVKDLNDDQRAFWNDQWADRLAGMHTRSKNWRR